MQQSWASDACSHPSPSLARPTRARRSRTSRLRSSYHFANLWFAGQRKNWPLAQFYLNETRSRLRWAVRIVPVRRIPGGEIDLRGLLEAVDATGFMEIGKAIADKNSEGFTFDPGASWP